jgi:hypothetical protein
MKRALMSLAGLYLLFAVIGRFVATAVRHNLTEG